MFVSNGLPAWFFENCFKKFYEKCLHFHSACRDHVYNLNIPYFDHDSRRFINKLKNIINSKFQLTLSQYFQMKTSVPPALCWNIFYQFFCSCDSSLTDIVMSTRRLSIRVGEPWAFI